MLRNYTIVRPEPVKVDATTDRVITVKKIDAHDRMTVEVTVNGRSVASECVSYTSSKSRDKLARALKLNPAQVLWLADKFKTSGRKAFTPADIPTDLPDAKTEDDTGKFVGRHVNDVASDALDAVGGNLRSAAGSLFIVRDDQLHCIKNTPELFGFLAGAMSGEGRHPIDWREGAGLVTKDEFRAAFGGKVEQFADVHRFPHHPPVPGVFYLTPTPPPGDGKALVGLLDYFCPATPIDRILIAAMWVTAVWGGPTGHRPMFLIRGEDDDREGGRGIGKPTIPEIIGWWLRPNDFSEGCIAHTMGEDAEGLKTRILTDSGERVVIWDNIKSDSLSNADNEGMVTSAAVSGRRLYVGNRSRPNLFTWVLTMNGVRSRRILRPVSGPCS